MIVTARSGGSSIDAIISNFYAASIMKPLNSQLQCMRFIFIYFLFAPGLVVDELIY
jgi:hypothetical protein